MVLKIIKERWFEKARNNGTWRVNICYDPRDMSYIYIKDDGGREFEKCFLLDHQLRYKGKSYDEINYLLEYEKTQAKDAKKVELQNKINLLEDIEKIIEEAKNDTKEEREEGVSNKKRIQNIRDNRNFEKEHRRGSVVEIKKDTPLETVREKTYGDPDEEVFQLLVKTQKEGKDRAGFDE